jgi:DNA-binding Lrp family transcriptional regulator
MGYNDNNNIDYILKETSNILGILSKYDALKIFLHSIEGIEAETDAADRLGLTKKQYYTRLKQLVDSGLIEKRQGKYVHTTLGKVIYEKAIRMLFEHVKNSKKLLMIDVLKSSGKFDIDEIYKLLQIKTEDIYYNARLLTDYDEFVRTVVSRLDDVDIKSIYYATRRLEPDIIRKILSKDIDIKLLIDISLVKYKEMYSIKEELKGNLKAVNIPFTIILFNNSSKEMFIELVNSKDPSRSYAFINIKDDPLVDKVKVWLDNLASSAGGGI